MKKTSLIVLYYMFSYNSMLHEAWYIDYFSTNNVLKIYPIFSPYFTHKICKLAGPRK